MDQSYEDFYRSLSVNAKTELRKIKNDLLKYYLPSAKEKIIEELDTDTRHQNFLKIHVKRL